MTTVTCRDCGRAGDEAPNDPAPGLCPGCYDRRLAEVTAKFSVMAETLEHPMLIMGWLELALVEIGGETSEAAADHVQALYAQLLEM